jgi:hypothetical protein
MVSDKDKAIVDEQRLDGGKPISPIIAETLTTSQGGSNKIVLGDNRKSIASTATGNLKASRDVSNKVGDKSCNSTVKKYEKLCKDTVQSHLTTANMKDKSMSTEKRRTVSNVVQTLLICTIET